jgi:ABC-2 type transport system ATP-binding protein
MTASAIAAPSFNLPTSTPAAVAFDGVTKRYGATTALDGVSFSIPTGSTVALLGPNGAGKSTAINLMLNLLRPDQGEIRVLGLTPAEAIASGRVGAMLQEGALPINVTVAELIGFARSLYPRPIPLNDVLATAGLSTLADRRTEGLSGGETQRLRFALAIAGDPDLVFLDEPTVAMDVESRRAFWADMRRLAEQGRSILFATHYLEEADQVADRIVVLDRGKVVADGTPASIKASVAGRTVRFTLANAHRPTLSALPGVSDVTIHGADVSIVTDDADATIRALYRTDLPIRDLEVTGAALEDAFVALTSGR